MRTSHRHVRFPASNTRQNSRQKRTVVGQKLPWLASVKLRTTEDAKLSFAYRLVDEFETEIPTTQVQVSRSINVVLGG